MLSAKQGSCEYHFLKSFGMTQLKELTPGLPTTKRTLSPLHHCAGSLSSSLQQTQPSVKFLSRSLCRICRIENPSCSACRHSSQDASHLVLHCPAANSLRRSFFGYSISLYDFWSRPKGVARLLGLHGLPPCPHPTEGVG